MTNESIMTDFIDAEMQTVSLLCTMGQWDGITEVKVRAWLNNFIDIEGKYYSLKILINSLYYSENDMTILLQHGIEDLIFGKIINRGFIKDKNLFMPNSYYSSHLKKLINTTAFIPLLAGNKPQESGNQLTRLLNQSVGIQSDHIFFHWTLNDRDLKKFDTIVILDDCIGSGDQLIAFWTSPEIEELKAKTKLLGIKWYYLVLVGYNGNLKILRPALPDLEIIVCEELTDKHRVFSPSSDTWKDEKERKEALSYFQRIEKERGVPVYGHGNLDFALFIHKNIPDWSLPIFWKNATDWEILLQRKNS